MILLHGLIESLRLSLDLLVPFWLLCGKQMLDGMLLAIELESCTSI